MLDGTQHVTITATANGYIGSASDSIDITDFETLTLVITESEVVENAGVQSVTATITRSNTDDLSQSLTVHLMSDDTTELTMAPTFVIPAAAASGNVKFHAVDDLILDGTQTLTVSASATGYPAAARDTLDILDHETWTHPLDPLDVNADNQVLANDALFIINSINTEGARQLPDRYSVDQQQVLFVDVSSDYWITPVDALRVINRLNEIAGNAEGEFTMVYHDPRPEAISPPRDASRPLSDTRSRREQPSFELTRNPIHPGVSHRSQIYDNRTDSDKSQPSPDDDPWESLLHLLSEDIAVQGLK